MPSQSNTGVQQRVLPEEKYSSRQLQLKEAKTLNQQRESNKRYMPTISLLQNLNLKQGVAQNSASQKVSTRLTFRDFSEVPPNIQQSIESVDYQVQSQTKVTRQKTTDHSHLLKKNLMPFGSV